MEMISIYLSWLAVLASPIVMILMMQAHSGGACHRPQHNPGHGAGDTHEHTLNGEELAR